MGEDPAALSPLLASQPSPDRPAATRRDAGGRLSQLAQAKPLRAQGRARRADLRADDREGKGRRRRGGDRPADGATPVAPFKLTAVFDVSQTDPLPDTEPAALEPPSRPIAGDSHRELLPRLEALAGELHYAVEYRDLGEKRCDGWCDSGRRLIVVGSHLAENAQVRVLVHELAHALGIGYEEFGRERAEVLVDCATYLVLQTVGLDVSGESVPYVADWGEDGALEAVQAFAGRIDAVARRIEDALADDRGRQYSRTRDTWRRQVGEGVSAGGYKLRTACKRGFDLAVGDALVPLVSTSHRIVGFEP